MTTTPTLLVANRAEIARRIIRTARAMGIRTVAMYEASDADLPYVGEADVAVVLPPSAHGTPYTDVAAVLAAAAQTSVTMVHPGYGFLSENAEFAQAVVDAGMTWIGPSPSAIQQMGDKVRAKTLMEAVGVPLLAGSDGAVTDAATAADVAAAIGFPVIVKAAAGGGGMGMELVTSADDLAAAFERTQGRAQRLYQNGDMLIEQYVTHARHVEVQILGLADGRVVALGERDCSVQRRHQKVAEESPSPFVGPGLRQCMLDAAVLAGEAIGYCNAGTVEFIVDTITEKFYFLEMNTRLQVEHPVTEAVTGIDLVREQIHVARGESPTFDPDRVTTSGHALELRVYAEDPVRFFPSPGTITAWSEPSGEGVRVDAGYRSGNVVSSSYDPLLAKLITHGATRADAIRTAVDALDELVIDGPKTNISFLQRLLVEPAFLDGEYDTSLVARMGPPPPSAVAARPADAQPAEFQ